MPVSDVYARQVRLLVRTLPLVFQEPCFALKGGTAINLFVRDLPRLSVDIDLTYLPVEDRDTSLAAIDAALRRIADAPFGDCCDHGVYGRLAGERVIQGGARRSERGPGAFRPVDRPPQASTQKGRHLRDAVA